MAKGKSEKKVPCWYWSRRRVRIHDCIDDFASIWRLILDRGQTKPLIELLWASVHWLYRVWMLLWSRTTRHCRVFCFSATRPLLWHHTVYVYEYVDKLSSPSTDGQYHIRSYRYQLIHHHRAITIIIISSYCHWSYHHITDANTGMGTVKTLDCNFWEQIPEAWCGVALATRRQRLTSLKRLAPV
jgi:hypothetical protein